MALTLDNLRDELNRALGKRLTDEDTDDTIADRHLNLSLQRLARVHNWKELLRDDSVSVTVTGTAATDVKYTGLPSNTREIFSLNVDTANTTLAHKLVRVPPRQWDQLIGRSELFGTGDITHYVVWNRTGAGQSGTPTIEWYRVPSANFTLYRRYSIWPATMSDDADTPDLINKEDLIIADTCQFFYTMLGEDKRAAVWAAARTNLLREAKEEDMSKEDMSFINRGATEGAATSPDYWQDPFINESP